VDNKWTLKSYFPELIFYVGHLEMMIDKINRFSINFKFGNIVKRKEALRYKTNLSGAYKKFKEYIMSKVILFLCLTLMQNDREN
jgi:hypothetical protein